MATEDAKAALLHLLPRSSGLALKMTDLMAGTGMARVTLERAMKSIPDLEKIGKGGKKDPVRYFRAPNGSAQTSIPEVSIGHNTTAEVKQ